MNTQHHQLIPFVLHLILGGFGGLIAASLAGYFGWRAADRLPGESRRPECVYCLRQFEWNEIFPLFGWLVRKNGLAMPCPCGARTGLWPQPLVEITGFVLGLAAMLTEGWSWQALPLVIGLGLLPAIALIDIFFGIIPDELNFLVGLCGFFWILMGPEDVYFAMITSASMLALGLFLAIGYSRFRGREMLGLGDVKFFAAAGLWLPLQIAPWFLAVSGILGVLFSLAWRYMGGGKELPFAPSLCLSLAACVFYQIMNMPLQP